MSRHLRVFMQSSQSMQSRRRQRRVTPAFPCSPRSRETQRQLWRRECHVSPAFPCSPRSRETDLSTTLVHGAVWSMPAEAQHLRLKKGEPSGPVLFQIPPLRGKASKWVNPAENGGYLRVDVGCAAVIDATMSRHRRRTFSQPCDARCTAGARRAARCRRRRCPLAAANARSARAARIGAS